MRQSIFKEKRNKTRKKNGVQQEYHKRQRIKINKSWTAKHKKRKQLCESRGDPSSKPTVTPKKDVYLKGKPGIKPRSTSVKPPVHNPKVVPMDSTQVVCTSGTKFLIFKDQSKYYLLFFPDLFKEKLKHHLIFLPIAENNLSSWLVWKTNL